MQAAASVRSKTTIREVLASVVREPRGGRTYVLVRVRTDSGLVGTGETAATPDGAAVVAAARRLGEELAGQDALAAVPIDERLRRAAPRHPGIRAAINMAVLDILGQTAEAPLYEVLGGPTREKVRAMAVVSGEEEEALREMVRRAWGAGYRAFAVPPPTPAGPTRGRSFYRRARQLLDAMRQEHGEGADFVLDCGGRITPAEGLSLAGAFEDFHLLWLDEPGQDASAEALSAVSEGAVTPVGYGRRFADNARFQDLLREDGIDVLRPDIALSGVTAIRKAAALAETYYLPVAPYNRGGPVATAAALHTGASVANFFIQEAPFTDGEDRTMRDALAGVKIEQPEDGFFALPPGPGLGLRVSEEALREYEVRV